ncbi:MAG: helix-turn-helix domain-containing protein, partial [Olsenella sp.]|nr:helix-turn-helix domain-containing protein [Olsenella sp.]
MAGPRKYCRLTKADRHAIQAALDTRGSCRSIAEGLGRSPSTVFCEAKRNRVAKRGPGKGEKAADVPEDACPKLLSWPYVCNGCRLRSCHCPKRWQAEYRAARAQALADEELSASRRGIDKTREQFEHIMGCVKEG